jgi:hypothetical protein
MWVDGKKGSILYYNIYTYIHVIKSRFNSNIYIYVQYRYVYIYSKDMIDIYIHNIDMYIFI